MTALDRHLGRDSTLDGFPGQILRWAGATLIFLVGGAHLLISGEHFLAAPYLGVLFLLNFSGSVVVAFGLYWSVNRWSWLLGDLICGGALVGFLVSRAAGLPGFTEQAGRWFSIAGLLTLMIEVAFMSLSLLAITPQGRALLRREQGRVEREEFPPAVQETPAHLEHIEREMAEIRSRMAPDLSNLRKHIEPRAVQEQIQRGVAEGLRRARVAFVSKSGGRRPGSLIALMVLAALAILVICRANGREDR